MTTAVAVKTGQATPGIYFYEGRIVKVQANKAKTNCYAKRLVIINGERLNEQGEHVHFEYEYAAGLVYKLDESMRMTKEQATAFGLQFGRCAWCGRALKQATSVERGVGPVCWSKFA